MLSDFAKIGLVLAAAATLGAAPASGPTSWMGVYKHRFANGLVTGEEYTSENIMELAPYSRTAAYLRLDLEFFNGHQCFFAGIVDVDGDHLTYRKDKADPPCRLSLSRKGDRLVLSDPGEVCAMAGCGARGQFDTVGFAVSSKRTIRYMPRLLASEEYKAAVAEYRKP